MKKENKITEGKEMERTSLSPFFSAFERSGLIYKIYEWKIPTAYNFTKNKISNAYFPENENVF